MKMQQNIIVGHDYEEIIEGSVGELLLQVLNMHEDNIIQIDAATDKKLRANQILDKAITFAKWLKQHNVGVGDSVSIVSENRLEFCIIPVAALFVGATFAPLNNDYIPRELNHALSLSKPKVIVCSESTLDKVVKIKNQHAYIEKILVFGHKTPKYRNVIMFESIVKGCEGKNIDSKFETTPLDPKETVATILCSSGTTGLPKGVMCTHHNITSLINIMREMMLETLENDDPTDPIIGLVPFFHSFGFMVMFLNILRGKQMIMISKFSTKVLLESIVNYKIGRLHVPPPVLLLMLKSPQTKKYDLSCIKEIRSGAAPLGKDLEEEVKRRWNIKHVSQSYGMTETTLGVLMSPQNKTKAGSVGVLVPGMMAKVVDESGNALGPYMEGELCFKGPLIMKGYVSDPSATAATIDEDQWLHTGDVAYYDEERYFFIVDRLKELIKYKAFQVAPAELEALLLTHPAVQDAAVVGLPDEEAGELPLAYVVKKPGHSVSEKELEKFVAANVSHQKRLRGGVVFIDAIPRNPTGKILRRKLREQAKNLKSKL